MKSLLLIFAFSLSSASAFSYPMTIKALPAFPLKGPAINRPYEEHQGHAFFICLNNAMESIAARYTRGITLKDLRVSLKDSNCSSDFSELVFKTTTINNGLHVLELISPNIESTPLAAYERPSLVLSLTDHSAAPKIQSANPVSIPLMKFRLIFNHAHNYDPTTYGQFVTEFQTIDKWERTSYEIISSRAETLPAGCHPRFPAALCSFTETIFRVEFVNSLTGDIHEKIVKETNLLP